MRPGGTGGGPWGRRREVMESEEFKEFVAGELAGRDFIVVSSREPYVHKKTSAGIKVEQPAGGLTSAMDDVLRAVGGTWVAWGSGSGDRAVSDRDRVVVPPDNPSYTLRRVWLTPREANNYYHGYSNRVLWPLSHMALDKVYFRKRYWKDYTAVNGKFARAILEEAKPHSIVWLHDYHLCLVPSLLRDAAPELTVAHFWHIPWPGWGVFRICPQAREILTAMLGNDLIGFQTPLFARNFMECVQECLGHIEGLEIDYRSGTVTYGGHTTRLKSFPISIDYDRFASAATSPRTETTIRKLREKFKMAGHVGVGVDRLDYTKALVQRLQALELFFEKYKRFRGNFTFVQIAVPTRLQEPYISYKRAVESLVNKINRKYATRDWMPVVYLDKKVDFNELVVYYRIADLAIISSLYDGMNLVAKEFAACQADEKGTLILSEFTGAAEELGGALFVNPYDIEGFADRIKEAIVMDREARRARMSVLRRQVREYDLKSWIKDIFSEMIRVATVKGLKHFYIFDRLDEVKKELVEKGAFLFLDFDGTLTPIVETPEMATIHEHVRELVSALARVVPVAIVSGRSLKDVMAKVGVEGIIYAGNHGAEIWDGEKTAVSQHLSVDSYLLKECLARLTEELGHIEGVIVEDKWVTASIHFRNVPEDKLEEFFSLFSKTTEPYEKSFRITSGKKVFEIRPLDVWNKGDAVNWIAAEKGGDRTLVYVGDDTTDEDAYRAVKGRGISISVGQNPEADYYLKAQEEVPRLLKELAEAFGVCGEVE